MNTITNENITKLSPPWHTYNKKLQALFNRDPEVHIKDLNETSEGNYESIVLVKNPQKAIALKTILNNNIQMGNININIIVVDEKGNVETNGDITIDTYKEAFTGNPIFYKVINTQYGSFKQLYCIFQKEVIQFFNDNLSDYCGNYSGLAQNIACEVIKSDENVSFCTSCE